MANEEHLRIAMQPGGLRKGSPTLAQLGGAKLDLTDADLSGADLSGADLSKGDLTGAKLVNTNLRGADLTWTQLPGDDLSGADLSGAMLSATNFVEANLSKANLTRAHLSAATEGRYKGAPGVNLTKANLTGANLTEANLRDVYLQGVTLRGADFSNIVDWGYFSSQWNHLRNSGAVGLWPEDRKLISLNCKTHRNPDFSLIVPIGVQTLRWHCSIINGKFNYRKDVTAAADHNLYAGLTDGSFTPVPRDTDSVFIETDDYPMTVEAYNWD